MNPLEIAKSLRIGDNIGLFRITGASLELHTSERNQMNIFTQGTHHKIV